MVQSASQSLSIFHVLLKLVQFFEEENFDWKVCNLEVFQKVDQLSFEGNKDGKHDRGVSLRRIGHLNLQLMHIYVVINC